MPNLNKTVTIGGLAIAGTVVRADDGELREELNLAAGKAGTLSARTDNDTGTATLASGHGITTGATVDVYFAGGLRRGMTVGTVAGTSVPIDLGTGDNLPALNDPIVLCVPTTVTLAFIAANVVMAVVQAAFRSSVQFQQTAGTVVKAIDLGRSGNNGEIWDWASLTDTTTPFTADVGKLVISNGDGTRSNTVKVGVVLNNAL
jgi:hypothetical protein